MYKKRLLPVQRNPKNYSSVHRKHKSGLDLPQVLPPHWTSPVLTGIKWNKMERMGWSKASLMITCVWDHLGLAWKKRYAATRPVPMEPQLHTTSTGAACLCWEEVFPQWSLPNICTTKCRPDKTEDMWVEGTVESSWIFSWHWHLCKWRISRNASVWRCFRIEYDTKIYEIKWNASREQQTELKPIVEERRKSSDPTMRKYHVLQVDECPIDEAPGKPSAVQRVHSQEMPLTKSQSATSAILTQKATFFRVFLS